MKKLRIKWNSFDFNTSEREAVIMFADDEISYKTFCKSCWSDEAKAELKKLKRLGGAKKVREYVKRRMTFRV